VEASFPKGNLIARRPAALAAIGRENGPLSRAIFCDTIAIIGCVFPPHRETGHERDLNLHSSSGFFFSFSITYHRFSPSPRLAKRLRKKESPTDAQMAVRQTAGREHI